MWDISSEQRRASAPDINNVFRQYSQNSNNMTRRVGSTTDWGTKATSKKKAIVSVCKDATRRPPVLWLASSQSMCCYSFGVRICFIAFMWPRLGCLLDTSHLLYLFDVDFVAPPHTFLTRSDFYLSVCLCLSLLNGRHCYCTQSRCSLSAPRSVYVCASIPSSRTSSTTPIFDFSRTTAARSTLTFNASR